MKTLYLMRHAKAEAAVNKQEDIDRELADRGREACEVVGEYMSRKGYHPAEALVSPAARTRETFELVTKSAHIAPQYTFEKGLYMANAEEIIKRLRLIGNDVESVMIVGHNPSMHHLALILAQPKSSDLHAELELKYPTGALTVLRFEGDSWQEVAPGQGELVDFMTPSFV